MMSNIKQNKISLYGILLWLVDPGIQPFYRMAISSRCGDITCIYNVHRIGGDILLISDIKPQVIIYTSYCF